MGRDAAVLGLAVLDAVADDIGKVLVQGPAARNVQQLHAAADAEDRKLAAIGGAHQRELHRVDPRLGRAEVGMGLGAVCARLDVGPAGQAQAIDAVEQGADRVRAQRRHDHRDPAGALDRLGIQRGQRHLDLRRLAMGPRAYLIGAPKLRGRDGDQGTSPHMDIYFGHWRPYSIAIRINIRPDDSPGIRSFPAGADRLGQAPRPRCSTSTAADLAEQDVPGLDRDGVEHSHRRPRVLLEPSLIALSLSASKTSSTRCSGAPSPSGPAVTRKPSSNSSSMNSACSRQASCSRSGRA